jgi:hypothetical protein
MRTAPSENNQLTNLETEVIEKIISSNIDYEILRRQLNSCSVESRTLTNEGFYTKLKVHDNSFRLITSQSAELSNVEAYIEGLKHGAGFTLFIRNGFIDTLEGYSYEESWPENIVSYKILN